jgi:hypothetical protein
MSWYQNSSENGVMVVDSGVVSLVCNSISLCLCSGCAVAVYQEWQFDFVCSLFKVISHHSSGGKSQFILTYCYVSVFELDN